MSKRDETKTFSLLSPADLYEKLLFDIERLRSACSSKDARFAAFDCAIGAWHLVDWTLHKVDDETHERLTGRKRNSPRDKSGKTVETIFSEVQKDRLPDLGICQMLANGAKHREVRNDRMPNLSSGSSVRLSWSKSPDGDGERSIESVTPFIYFKLDGEKYNAIELFEEVARQWHTFLGEEKLLEQRPDWPDDE